MIYSLTPEYFVRSLTDTDIEGQYKSWFSDQEVCMYNSHGKFFKTDSYFKHFIESLNNEKQIVWAICHIADGHIGNVSLQDISFINRTAEFAIILGNKNHWGKGIGKLAGTQLLKHGFNKLNLFKIYCGTATCNEGMKKLASALGMTLEGTRRQQVFLEGERVDILEYGVLASEFPFQ